MARAAMPARNWRGSNSTLTAGFMSKSSSAVNLRDSMEDTSALHSMIGAQGRRASALRVILRGRRDDVGKGGAEQ